MSRGLWQGHLGAGGPDQVGHRSLGQGWSGEDPRKIPWTILCKRYFCGNDFVYNVHGVSTSNGRIGSR